METKNTTNDVCMRYAVVAGNIDEVRIYDIPANEVKKPTEAPLSFIKRVGKEVNCKFFHSKKSAIFIRHTNLEN